MSAKRICIATSIHDDYDARVFRHAKSVARAGYDVDLVCPWRPGEYVVPAGLRLVPFPRVVGRAARPVSIPARMWSLLMARQYDLYHFHDIDLLPLFVLIRRVTGRPVVYDCHENYADEMLYRSWIPKLLRGGLHAVVRELEPRLSRQLDGVVTVVPRQGYFAQHDVGVTLVRNFAELALASGRRDDHDHRPPTCVFIGKHYIDNGSRLLVEVAARVHRARPDVRFVTPSYFAEPELEASVRSAVVRKGLEAVVDFRPRILSPEVMDVLNQGTIGLALDLDTAHRRGALPMKLSEYMAAGLPVVAADLPKTRALVMDADFGLLVKPGDAQGYADAIVRLVQDPVLARSLGNNGARAFDSRLNWEAEISGLTELYERLFAIPRSRPSLAPAVARPGSRSWERS